MSSPFPLDNAMADFITENPRAAICIGFGIILISAIIASRVIAENIQPNGGRVLKIGELKDILRALDETPSVSNDPADLVLKPGDGG